MKLFNGLRKRIVNKLIRPDDGYIYTGSTDGEQVGFYYDEYTDQYVLSMKSKYDKYFVPSLTGWRIYIGKYEELKEVTFQKWIYGILDNICDEYFARLDNISLKELKSIQDYRRQEDGEKFMITKKSFCDIMDALDSYWTNLRALEGILNVYFERGMMADIIDQVVDALEEELEPQFYDPDLDFDINEDPMIMRWLTGLESDRTVDGELLSNAEELYDYLVEKREKNLKKFENTP